MADPVFLGVDQGRENLESWQLCKTLAAEGTILTAAKLAQSLNDVSFAEAVDLFPVSRYGKIRVQVWGDTAADGNTIFIDVYGWSKDGPGHYVAELTGTFGNFTSAASTGFHTNAHKSITNEFDAATAYRGCDTWAIASNGDHDGAISVVTAASQKANYPSYFTVDLTGGQYKYLSFHGVGGTQSGSIAAIFKPLSLKKEFPQRVL